MGADLSALLNMPTSTAKMAAARAFVRSLNILLKFVRLYGFDHARAAEQFKNAWTELRAAIPASDESGLLLGTSGSQLILDGAPIEAAHAERSFAQLLSAAGLASIHFLPCVTPEDLAQFVRAFPVGNAKPSSLAEQLKTALVGTKGIRINQLRFFAEDSSTTEVRLAASLTAKTLGADASQVANWLSDPQKLLQLIAAAEGARGGAGGGSAGTGSGGTTSGGSGSPSDGSSQGGAPTDLASPNGGTASGTVAPPAVGAGTGLSVNAGSVIENDEILNVLRLVTRLGQTAGASAAGESPLEPGPFQQEISKLSGHSRDVLQQAVAALAARVPALKPNDPMLLQLAEHVAIRFALDRYERGEVRVNAVREMLERMTQEIAGLRKVLGSHEETLAQAGIVVESHADLLDRQFWASVPEAGKRTVLTSPDAWCIPPRNVRQFVEELRHKGDHATANIVLENFASAIGHEDATARRRAAIGLADLADLYAAGDGLPLGSAIGTVGLRLAVERDSELQDLICAAFVCLTQEAAARKRYRAVLQSLDSLDSIELQRPSFAQGVRPRLGVEKHLPDFIDDALKAELHACDSSHANGGLSDVLLDGLLELIGRVPRQAADHLVHRFNRSAQRSDCVRIAALTRTLGADVAGSLRESLQAAPPTEAAECVGLAACLDAVAVEKQLGDRLHDWPRMPQDRAIRLVAGRGAAQRGWLLLSIFDRLDPVLHPLTVDEIGMSADLSAVEILVPLAADNSAHDHGPYLRLKAVEALGRLRASAAAPLLREIAESKKHWRWLHPFELRLAAFQALANITPSWAEEFFPRSGFNAADLDLAPLSPVADTPLIRQRRYPRLTLKEPIAGTASSERDTIALVIRGLSLSGGRAGCEKHITPGTLVSLKIGSGLRPIRAQAFLRDARAQGIGFEFADIDLEERARLRRLLRENGVIAVPIPKPAPQSAEEQNAPALTASHH